MNLPQSPALRALRSIRKAGPATWCWFGIYLLAATVVLEVLLLAGRHFWPDLRDFALGYVFPESWHPFVLDLAGRLLSGPLAVIVASTGIGLGVLAVGITLFPVKEKLSASFEDDVFPEIPKGRELSLFQQGIEEMKLHALYAVFQSLALYCGVQGLPFLAVAGVGLGFWYLVVAMALDHVAPAFQRRGVRLPEITWIVFTRVPLSLHLLGALFILPSVALQLWAATHLRPELAIALVAGAEVIGMAFATLAGCTLGVELIAAGATMRKAPGFWGTGVTIVAGLILLWQAVFLTWWALAIQRKSQFLKCDYAVDWRNFDHESHGRPSSGGQVAVVTLSLPVSVTNPTRHAIGLEEMILEVQGREGGTLGTMTLTPLLVPGGTTTEVRLEGTLEIPVDPLLNDWRRLVRPSGLRFFLVLDPPMSRPVRFAFEEFGVGR